MQVTKDTKVLLNEWWGAGYREEVKMIQALFKAKDN